MQELSFSPEYYCDEIREGFFVSETMKRFWAGQLSVLAEIDKICKKHNINWYADSGTMLGAVRHKGYIPWDDDLDIAIFRADYYKFLAYAREEMPKEYRFFSSDEQDLESELPFARIVSTGAYNYDKELIARNNGCPFSVGVDVFPIDNVSDDEEVEQKRVKKGKLLYATLSGMYFKTLSDGEIDKNIKKIEIENDVVIGSEDRFNKLVKLFEKIAQEFNNEQTQRVAVMPIWLGEGRGVCFRKNYEKWVELPFETTSVRIAGEYQEVLGAYYGDYMKPVRGTAVHEYPIYRVLEERFRSRYGKNPTLRYFFDKEHFVPRTFRKTFWDQQKELVSYLYQFHNAIEEKNNNQEADEASKFLQTCQNVAITIGTAIEGKYGDGTKAVQALENYCEKIYEASTSWSDNTRKDLNECLATAEKRIDELVSASKKETLFLLCKASWWSSIKDVYSKEVNSKETNVSVIPVSYSYLDHTKKLIGWQNDLNSFEKYPELYCHLTSFEEYKLEKKRPDRIVIQFPYDGYSGILAISQELFTERLLDYTDELVFVPYLEPDSPVSKKDVAYAAMQELVEQPAVFNADRILIGSKELRTYYVEKLIDMTDKGLKDYWNKRICLKENI